MDSKGIELDYFGRKTKITNEMEIFSVLIKEEIEQWKDTIRETDIRNIFARDDDNMDTLYKVVELMCMNVNMEQCDGLYLTSTDRLTTMLGAVMSISLRKPIYTEGVGKKVITISADYKDKDLVESDQCQVLYHVSLTNGENKQVSEEDRVVLC